MITSPLLRSSSLFLLLAAVIAGEAVPPPPVEEPVVIDPALLTFVINKAVHNKADNEEGIFEGGVAVWYERIRLASDLIHYWQSPLGVTTAPGEAGKPPAEPAVPGDQAAAPPAEDTGKDPGTTAEDGGAATPATPPPVLLGPDGKPLLFLERILIDSGPDGPEPDRIHLDTRFTELKTINFRGLLRPRRLVMQRQPLDPARPGILTYTISLPGLRDFRGRILQGGKAATPTTPEIPPAWIPIVGYADIAILTIELEQVAGTMQNPRFRRIELVAPEKPEPGGRNHVMLEVYGEPQAGDGKARFTGGRILSKGRIILDFRDDGSLGDQRAEGYTLFRGLKPGAVPDMDEGIPEITPEDYWDKGTGPKAEPAPKADPAAEPKAEPEVKPKAEAEAKPDTGTRTEPAPEP